MCKSMKALRDESRKMSYNRACQARLMEGRGLPKIDR